MFQRERGIEWWPFRTDLDKRKKNARGARERRAKGKYKGQ